MSLIELIVSVTNNAKPGRQGIWIEQEAQFERRGQDDPRRRKKATLVPLDGVDKVTDGRQPVLANPRWPPSVKLIARSGDLTAIDAADEPTIATPGQNTRGLITIVEVPTVRKKNQRGRLQ